jgi:putative tryptophan/tyrosine transport system substrate-binding protein
MEMPERFKRLLVMNATIAVGASPSTGFDNWNVITAFARSPNGGLIVTGSALATVHRNLIVTLAARHKLPAVYYEQFFAAAGGLISYGPDFLDLFRRSAGYVDRTLKGEKPADLPVQAPAKNPEGQETI